MTNPKNVVNPNGEQSKTPEMVEPQPPKTEKPNEEGEEETVSDTPKGDKKFHDLVTGFQAALMRSWEPNLPVWSSEWADSENQTSFKAHAKAFESYAKMLQWDKNMKALKFQMTLRGKIRQHIDTLDEETASDYDLLKKELMAVYHETKDPHTKIHEWNAIVWRPKSMKLQRLGALLLTGYKAFMTDKGSNASKKPSTESELMLKDRFLKAVREGHPKFAQFIELNRPQGQTYKELVSFCANKFQVYRHEMDVEEEDDVVALVAADNGRLSARQNYATREHYRDGNYRQEYRPRDRSLERTFGERMRQVETRNEPREGSLYDRRRDEWRRQNAWKYEQYENRYRQDGNRYRQDEYQVDRYQRGRDRYYGQESQFRRQQREPAQNYTPRRSLGQPMRGGYERRMNIENQEQRRYNDRRGWQDSRPGNWNNGGRRQYHDNKQQEQSKRDNENGKKGTTVPENRKITFLEEKAKN